MELVEFFDDIPYVLIKVELTLNSANKYIKKYDSHGYKLLVKEVDGYYPHSLFFIYEESVLAYY